MIVYKCDYCKKELGKDGIRVVFGEQESLELCENCHKKYSKKQAEYDEKMQELHDEYEKKREELHEQIFNQIEEEK